jgi:predicted permease
MPDVAWAQPTVPAGSFLLVVAAAVITGLVAGLAPALHASARAPSPTLKDGGGDIGNRRSLTRAGLLVAQAAFSIVLISGAALFVRSLGKLDALDLGYDTEQLIRANIALSSTTANRQARDATFREAALAIESLPGVEGVALATAYPMGGYSSTSVYLPDDPLPLSDPSPSYVMVAPEFFSVVGMSIVEGRTFDRGETDVAVVNEMLARRAWPGRSAIGQCIMRGRANADCTRVVGVAEDARRSRILEEMQDHYFIPLMEDDAAGGMAVRFTGDSEPIIRALRAELERTYDPDVVRVQHMSTALAPQLRPWRLGAQLFTAFGLLALLVTAVGIYSVMSYAVSQRTHEMGVRIALGARVKDVLHLVVGEGLGVIGIGIVVGIAIALALGRLVAALLYGVTPRDPIAMAAAALVLITVGIVASLVPAWRAARVDPVRALSVE